MPTTAIARCGGGPTGPTYAAVLAIIAGSNPLIAQWHLNDGAAPYADTSGFAPGDPATMQRQVFAIPMTQAYTPGPLTRPAAESAVGFNFDGTAVTGTGDYLHETCSTPARFYFAGNLTFSVIAWVVPFQGVVVHDGPVLNLIHVTSFGTPGAHDDGWRINVTQPGLIPSIQRASNVMSGGSYDTAAGAALSITDWAMLVGTYDGATLRLYQDGVLASSAASAGAIGGVAVNAQIGAGTTPLGGNGTWHYGTAGEITIQAGVLTAQNVADLWAAGSV